MIGSTQFKELPYEGKISCLKEIFAQVTTPSPSLDDIRDFLDSDFQFQEQTLLDLFGYIEKGISEGKQLDEKKIADYISNMKLEAQKSQEADSKKADELLMDELLEQDAIREQIEKEKTDGNGKLDKKEIERLNNRDELYYKGGYNFLYNDILSANMNQLKNKPDVYKRLDAMNEVNMSNFTTKIGEPKRVNQVRLKNRNNKTELDHLNNVLKKYYDGMRKAGNNSIRKRIVNMNTLLVLNNTSLKNIADFSLFSDSTIKAMHQYQNTNKNMNSSDNWSKADCIFGYRTVDQIMHNVGIDPRTIINDNFVPVKVAKKNSPKPLNKNFDNKTNANAIKIDEERGYYKKNFVIDGLTVYRDYLQVLKEHMRGQGFTNADDKLKANIKNITLNIDYIRNANLDDDAINKKIDALIINPAEYKSWMQNVGGSVGTVAAGSKNIGEGYLKHLMGENYNNGTYINRFKKLLKNPGNFQSSRKDIIDIFRKMDNAGIAAGVLDNHSEAYGDMARDQFAKSREVYNDTKKVGKLEHDKNTIEDRSIGQAIRDIDKLLSFDKDGKNVVIDRIYDVLSKNVIDQKGENTSDEDLSKLIAKEIENIVNSYSNKYKDLKMYIKTRENRWHRFMGGDDIQNMVLKIQDNANHLYSRRENLRESMNKEYENLKNLNNTGRLDPRRKSRLDALQKMIDNGGIDENTISAALQSAEKAMISGALKEHMFFKVMDGKTDNEKNNIIAQYDSIIGAGKGISDKYANKAIDTTIYLAQEIIIMAASGGAGALAERALVGVAVKVFEGMNAGRKLIAAVEASGLSGVELAGVGIRGAKYVDKLVKAGRVVEGATATVNMTKKIGGIASFLSKGSLITRESLEIAKGAKGLTTMMKLGRYAINGTIFHLSATTMNNIVDGNDLSTGMELKEFAKSIAFIGVLSEISSVFRMTLPLNNPKAAGTILNTPVKTAGKKVFINTGKILASAGKVGAEISTEVAALLGTSRVVSVMFGEDHPDLTPNEIAHTIAIVLGMKGFHGIVNIKNAKKGEIEIDGKSYDLGKDLTKISEKELKNKLDKIDHKKTQTPKKIKENSEAKRKENSDLRKKKTELNKQKKQLEKEINSKKYGLEKGTQPELWTKEILDNNLDDMIKWLDNKLKNKTTEDISNNAQLGEYSMILELFNGYKANSSTEANAKPILEKLNLVGSECHYTEPATSEIKSKKDKLDKIDQEISDINTSIKSNSQDIKNNSADIKKKGIWYQKQWDVYAEDIKVATELVHKIGDVDGALNKLKDVDNLTREDIKDIQRELGMKGRKVDGILGPETLKAIEKKYLDKVSSMSKGSTESKNKVTEEESKKTEEESKKTEEESKKTEEESKKTEEESKKTEEESKKTEEESKKEKSIEEDLSEPSKVETESHAKEILDKVEQEIDNTNLGKEKIDSVFSKLESWYKGLKESLQGNLSIKEKIKNIIDKLVVKLSVIRNKEAKNKIKRGDVKMPDNFDNLPPHEQALVMQANLMQEWIPGYKKFANFTDGKYIGKERLASTLGFIPFLGNIGITGINVIQGAIGSYYAKKIGLGNDFHWNNFKRQVMDTTIGNIPYLGFIGDIFYKANKRNLGDMVSAYKKSVDQLHDSGVSKEFIDHHIKVYEQISGKKYTYEAVKTSKDNQKVKSNKKAEKEKVEYIEIHQFSDNELLSLHNREIRYGMPKGKTLEMKLGESGLKIEKNDVGDYVISSKDLGESVVIKKGESITIGRNHTFGNKEFTDLYMSGEHIQISVGNNGELYIKDLNSANGSKLKEVYNSKNSPEYENNSQQSISFQKNNIQEFEKVKLNNISNKFLEEFGQPKHVVDMGGIKLYVTDVLHYRGKRYIVGYTDTGEVRLFYRSSSEAEWRSCPGLRSGGGYSKGNLISGSSYETTTKLEQSLNNFFDGIINNEIINTDPIIESYNISGKVHFNEESMSKSLSINQLYSYKHAVDFYKGRTISKVKKAYASLEVPGLDYSSMRLDKNRGYTFKHDYLGEISVDIVRAKLSGKDIDIHFAHAKNNHPDDVFITNMVYSDAKVNSFGIYDNQINAGPITAKPIDYIEQGPSGGSKLQEYGNTYIDIRELYQDMPLIKEYKKQILQKQYSL